LLGQVVDAVDPEELPALLAAGMIVASHLEGPQHLVAGRAHAMAERLDHASPTLIFEGQQLAVLDGLGDAAFHGLTSPRSRASDPTKDFGWVPRLPVDAAAMSCF
jgi:hypothetical protein